MLKPFVAVSAVALACSSFLIASQARAQAPDAELLRVSKPGECYARVVTPAKYENFSERVLAKAATKRLEVSPARYETVEEEFVVSEASSRLEVIPATYKMVAEEVEVSPASSRLEVIPAVYEEVSERVLVREAYTTWKRGSAWLSEAKAVRTGTGKAMTDSQRLGVEDDVMCLVEVPAEYKTVTHRIEKSPAATREVAIAARSAVVNRRVLDQAATTRTIEIPAVTRMVKVVKLVEPAQERAIEIPAEYGQITKTRMVADAKVEWRSILCETNATHDKIMEIQRALQSTGFNPGKIDGIIKSDTMRAVNAYQQAKGLPVDPYLNMQTVAALGVKVK